MLTAAGLALGLVAVTSWAGAPQALTSHPTSKISNPYSPAYGHTYRHGVIPTRDVHQKMKQWRARHQSILATSTRTLSYGGGTSGSQGNVGVNSGHSKVYLVFYGTQWGTQTTDANGNLKFSNDTAGAAGAAQQMFKGIGTNNELWSAELTQWCDGPNVSAGATSCPSNASFIPYQTGGVLAGVWYDNSVSSPSAATAAQLGQEAVKAAGHFGNTTSASNRYAYYVILSPKGTNPDNYQGQYCAWHDWNGDVGVSSQYGDLAFSNQPYNIDSGAGCGVGFVNSPGTLDGWTMTLGHEWHEMMSDQYPAGGWTNQTGSSYNGEENSDECAWIAPGSAGGAANVSFGSFGTFAEQASWSNDTNSCAISHAIVGGGGNSAPTANNGSISTAQDTPKSGTLSATDPNGDAISFSIVTNPAHGSVTINNLSTGAFTYTPASGYTGSDSFTFKATDNGGLASNTATESVTVTSTVNHAPVASNGSVTTTSNTAVNSTLAATDQDGNSLTFSVVTSPAHGSVSITNAATGAFTYTPVSGYSGSDSFTFKATDSGGLASNTATESVTVNASTGCASGYTAYTGSISQGSDVYEPNGTYYHTTVTGTNSGILTGPAGKDYDLYLYKWNGSRWAVVASSTGTTASETINYSGTSGYYEWDIYAYSGSGTFQLCLKHPN